jgi:hypothetical protein
MAMHRAFHIVGWGYVAICTALVLRSTRGDTGALTHSAAPPQRTPSTTGSSAAEWFRRARPYCNAVEVATVQRGSPAPATAEGAGYEAACFALAGRIDDARRRIDALPTGQRVYAAAIVFATGHPVADAGDDRSAGPIMELVIDYWPDHYMALYHAGMAEYMLGQHALARKNLTAFLQIYQQPDGWRNNAMEILKRLDDPAGHGQEQRRPREPGQ